MKGFAEMNKIKLIPRTVNFGYFMLYMKKLRLREVKDRWSDSWSPEQVLSNVCDHVLSTHSTLNNI